MPHPPQLFSRDICFANRDLSDGSGKCGIEVYGRRRGVARGLSRARDAGGRARGIPLFFAGSGHQSAGVRSFFEHLLFLNINFFLHFLDMIDKWTCSMLSNWGKEGKNIVFIL